MQRQRGLIGIGLSLLIAGALMIPPANTATAAPGQSSDTRIAGSKAALVPAAAGSCSGVDLTTDFGLVSDPQPDSCRNQPGWYYLSDINPITPLLPISSTYF